MAPTLSTFTPALASLMLERLFLTPIKHPQPKREQEWIASASRTRVPIDSGRSLAVYTWGDGPAVLLVHGWSGRGSQMAIFAEPLVRLGYRVVAFDAPGHGASDGKRSSLPEFARAIEVVAKHVGPLHALVAHSMGAAAATIAVHRGVEVERVAYLAPPEHPGQYLDRAAEFLGFSEAVARVTQWRIEDRFGIKFEEARGSTLAPALDAPLLLVHDATDTEVPYAEGVLVAASWPGAHLHTTYGLGHYRVLRDPTVVDAIVDFVTVRPAPAEPAAPPAAAA